MRGIPSLPNIVEQSQGCGRRGVYAAVRNQVRDVGSRYSSLTRSHRSGYLRRLFDATTPNGKDGFCGHGGEPHSTFVCLNKWFEHPCSASSLCSNNTSFAGRRLVSDCSNPEASEPFLVLRSVIEWKAEPLSTFRTVIAEAEELELLEKLLLQRANHP